MYNDIVLAASDKKYKDFEIKVKDIITQKVNDLAGDFSDHLEKTYFVKDEDDE